MHTYCVIGNSTHIATLVIPHILQYWEILTYCKNIGKSARIARRHWSVGHVHTHWRLKADNRSANSTHHEYNAIKCSQLQRRFYTSWIQCNAIHRLKAHIHISWIAMKCNTKQWNALILPLAYTSKRVLLHNAKFAQCATLCTIQYCTIQNSRLCCVLHNWSWMNFLPMKCNDLLLTSTS